MEKHRLALDGDAEKDVKLVASIPPPQAAQLPPELERCLKRILAKQPAAPKKGAPKKVQIQEVAPDGTAQPPEPPSADKLVIAKLESELQRNACVGAVLKWQRDQKARDQKAKAAAK